MSKETFNPRAYWESRFNKGVALDTVGYLGLGKPFNKWSYRVRAANFRRALAKDAISKPARVLDIGSGSGFYIDLWSKYTPEHLVGLDTAEPAVQHLQARFPQYSFHRRDITEADALAQLGQFDHISMMDVLFHITDDQRYAQALENISAALSSNGTFIFSENFLDAGQTEALHQKTRSADTIYQALEEAGLEPVSRSPFIALMGPPLYFADRPLTRTADWHPSTSIITGRRK